MFQVKFRIGNGSQSQVVSALLRNLGDAKPLLRRWAGFFRKKAKDRFNELSGPGLAASTLRKYAATRKSNITSSGNVRVSYARHAEAQIRRKYKNGKDGSLTERGSQVLGELRRLLGGGSPTFSGLEVQEKSIERLRKRLERARRTGRRVGGEKRKGDSHKLLGRLRASLVSAVSDRVARLINRVPWSGAHNEGATVGHGAGLPRRLTLEVTGDDARELAKIALEQATGKGRTK